MAYDDLQPPARLPEPGFYRHYKHDPNMRRADCPDAHLRNYVYRVLPNFGLFTEETPHDLFQVDYLPLYPWAKVYQISLAVGRACEDHRPVSLFLSDVDTPAYNGPRFTRIVEPDLIELYERIFDEMWGIFPPK